jgi:hypothetical protein
MATRASRARAAAETEEPTPDEPTPDEPEPEGDDGDGDKRAKLPMADPYAGMTPGPLPAAEGEEEEEEGEKKSTGAKYEEKTLILPGTWVILADTPNVPKEVVGHEAAVTLAPTKTSDGDEQIPTRHQYQDEDTRFTVETRDMYSATIPNLTKDDFEVVSFNGRAGLRSAG